jgi:DNA topoisomerase-1
LPHVSCIPSSNRTCGFPASGSPTIFFRSRAPQSVQVRYLPHHPIYYKSKKTAQEAHEAIRPTSVERTPESLKRFLEPDLWKLYALIWHRFVGSQMNPAVFDQTDVLIDAGRVQFKATGSVLKFDGFLAVYQEMKPEAAKRDAEGEEQEGLLPELSEGEQLDVKSL